MVASTGAWQVEGPTTGKGPSEAPRVDPAVTSGFFVLWRTTLSFDGARSGGPGLEATAMGTVASGDRWDDPASDGLEGPEAGHLGHRPVIVADAK